jgi:hypothetical protein
MLQSNKDRAITVLMAMFISPRYIPDLVACQTLWLHTLFGSYNCAMTRCISSSVHRYVWPAPSAAESRIDTMSGGAEIEPEKGAKTELEKGNPVVFLLDNPGTS